MELQFVNEDNADLISLSGALDAFYFDRFGEQYLPYLPHNKLTGLAGSAVAYKDGTPCGCVCWKAFDAVTAELKRMFVRDDCRRQGIARALVEAVEAHAAASGCHRMVLETAVETPEAVAFYRAIGYTVLKEGFGPYIGDADCVCFEKEISDGTMR